MKCLNPRLTHEYGRGWLICFEVEDTGLAKIVCDKFRDGYVDVQVEKWSEKRSLQANAYFHVLCNLIAKETKSSIDDVKKMLVSQYGTLARGEDGKYLGAVFPPNTKPEAFYPYVKWYGKAENGFDQYLFYKQTHLMNKEEMGRLIDGAVEEAKALGIETMTPDEIMRMMNRYKEPV